MLEEQPIWGGSAVVVLDVSSNILAKKANHTRAHARHLARKTSWSSQKKDGKQLQCWVCLQIKRDTSTGQQQHQGEGGGGGGGGQQELTVTPTPTYIGQCKQNMLLYTTVAKNSRKQE